METRNEWQLWLILYGHSIFFCFLISLASLDLIVGWWVFSVWNRLGRLGNSYFLAVITVKFYSIIEFQPINFWTLYALESEADVGLRFSFLKYHHVSCKMWLDEETVTSLPCKCIVGNYTTYNIQTLQHLKSAVVKKACISWRCRYACPIEDLGQRRVGEDRWQIPSLLVVFSSSFSLFVLLLQVSTVLVRFRAVFTKRR